MVGGDGVGAGTGLPPAKSEQTQPQKVAADQIKEIPELCGVTEDFEHYWIIDKTHQWRINYLNPRKGIVFQAEIAKFNKLQEEFFAQKEPGHDPTKPVITQDDYEASQLKMIEYVFKTTLLENDGSPLDYDKMLDWDAPGWSLSLMAVVAQDLVTFLKVIGSKAAAQRLRMLSKLTT